jgi:serine/threonine protein kinase
MTPERWQQVKVIFNSAINYRPEERGLFLFEACLGDEELRREVESLIESHERSGEFIDDPAYKEAASMVVDRDSELQPGQAIASYEIVSFLSRGGMGEVYVAHDRRLSRKVALKLLPASYTRDADRLRRFEQEARAASALNHPNIITIYEILKANSTHLIVTEFVEGETLRQRLAHTRLGLSEALQVAIQIADALSAAHKVGIIHRDIKPENIMLRPDGYVKILDFGLAKLTDLTPSVVAAEAPTRQVRTGSGIVMGTAGYMSPEQARGLIVDSRSDIFSLGAVIYEMVAARKPFDGQTPSDVLAAILKTEPPRLSNLVPGLPPELVRIVTKALQKDREERYQVVKDLLLDLKSLKQELEFHAKLEQSSSPNRNETSILGLQDTATNVGSVPETAEIKSPVSTITESLTIEIKRHKTGALLILAALLAVTASGYWLYKNVSTRPRPTHFQPMKITRLTNSGKAIDATISPDGKYLVYVLSDAGKQSLWIRQVSTANDKMVLPPAPVGFFGMTFSLDGNDLYYTIKANLDAGTLYRVPVLGGIPARILSGIDAPVSFSPDGKQLVFVRSNYPQIGDSALIIANSDGSNERVLALRQPPQRFSPIFFTGPSWSPDGKLIAASVSVAGANNQVKLFSVAEGKEQSLTSSWSFASRVQWLPDMTGLLVIGGEHPGLSQIWFVSYPDGALRKVTNDLNGYRTIGLTQSGSSLSTIQTSGMVNIWVAPEGDAGRAVQLPTGNIGFYASGGINVSWASDGRIAFASNESGAMDIWLMNADGSNRKQLTSNAGQNVSPVVTPDGRYIVFLSLRNGGRSIWRVNVDGSNPRQLTSGVTDGPPAVTPDSNWILYTYLEGAKPVIMKVSIDGGASVKISDEIAVGPTVSPDGKYIAYFYPESADPLAPPNRIGVMPINGGPPEKTFGFQPSGTIGAVAQWSSDSRSILYLVNTNNVTNIWSQPLNGDTPKQITDFKDSLMTGFSWTPDGKQLACTRGILLRDAVLITEGR